MSCVAGSDKIDFDRLPECIMSAQPVYGRLIGWSKLVATVSRPARACCTVLVLLRLENHSRLSVAVAALRQ